MGFKSKSSGRSFAVLPYSSVVPVSAAVKQAITSAVTTKVTATVTAAVTNQLAAPNPLIEAQKIALITALNNYFSKEIDKPTLKTRLTTIQTSLM